MQRLEGRWERLTRRDGEPLFLNAAPVGYEVSSRHLQKRVSITEAKKLRKKHG